MPSLLIRDAVILTLDARRRVLRGDVRAEDGVVTNVGRAPQHADTVIEAGGDILMPGLVNAHTHAPMTLLRGLGDDLALEEWLRTRIWPAERHLTRDDVRVGTQLAMLEMLRTGTTSFNDMYFFSDTTARAAADAGMRASVGATLIDFDTSELKLDEQEPNARRFVAEWEDHPLVTPTLSPHSTYICGPERWERVRAIQEEHDVQVHTHCSETRHEVQDVLAKLGVRPVEVMRRAGVLKDSILAHCGWVTKDEIRVLAAEGAHVAHCPVSNLKLATGGVMPMLEMREAGVNVALGTDGAASNNTLDILETTKYAALLQKHHRWDARAAPAEDVLHMATVGGRRALRQDTRGIEVGAIADLALVDAQPAHMRPWHDPASSLVYCANGGDVRATIVAGRVLYLDGRFTTLDEARILDEAEACGARLAKAVREGLAKSERA